MTVPSAARLSLGWLAFLSLLGEIACSCTLFSLTCEPIINSEASGHSRADVGELDIAAIALCCTTAVRWVVGLPNHPQARAPALCISSVLKATGYHLRVPMGQRGASH